MLNDFLKPLQHREYTEYSQFAEANIDDHLKAIAEDTASAKKFRIINIFREIKKAKKDDNIDEVIKLLKNISQDLFNVIMTDVQLASDYNELMLFSKHIADAEPAKKPEPAFVNNKFIQYK